MAINKKSLITNLRATKKAVVVSKSANVASVHPATKSMKVASLSKRSLSLGRK